MQNLNLNNLEANKRGAANSHRNRGAFDTETALSVQEKAAQTRKTHDYLMPGNQLYQPPSTELEHRLATKMLVSELAAMGFEVRVTKIATIWFGRGVQPVPHINGPYHAGGKTYFGFSVR